MPAVETVKKIEEPKSKRMTGNVQKPAWNTEQRLREWTREDRRGVAAGENSEQHDADLCEESEAKRFTDWLHGA